MKIKLRKDKRIKKDVPNEPMRVGVGTCFKIYIDKFWKIILLNIMYSVLSIPAYIVSAFFASYFYLPLMSSNYEADLSFRLMFAFVMICGGFVVIGPIHAGFISILQKFCSETPVFLFSDFFKEIKSNWKQSLIVSLINFLITLLIGYSILFYSNIKIQIVSTVLVSFALILFALFCVINIYVYPMMVIFDYSIKNLYGNAIRFAAAEIVRNVLIVAFIVAFAYVLHLYMYAIIVFVPLIAIGTVGFIVNYSVYVPIKKYLIDRIKGE